MHESNPNNLLFEITSKYEISRMRSTCSNRWVNNSKPIGIGKPHKSSFKFSIQNC
jgi:hypothetical protein